MALFDEEWDIDISREKDTPVGVLLSDIDIFKELTDDELDMVQRIVHPRFFLPNEVIVKQGAPGVGMYIIETGAAEVLLEATNGEMIHLVSLGEKQFFGEMSLLDGSPRAANVVATERTQAIGFFRPDLIDLVAQSPTLGLKIVYRLTQLMGGRLHETLKEFRQVQRQLQDLQDTAKGGR